MDESSAPFLRTEAGRRLGRETRFPVWFKSHLLTKVVKFVQIVVHSLIIEHIFYFIKVVSTMPAACMSCRSLNHHQTAIWRYDLLNLGQGSYRSGRADSDKTFLLFIADGLFIHAEQFIRQMLNVEGLCFFISRFRELLHSIWI